MSHGLSFMVITSDSAGIYRPFRRAFKIGDRIGKITIEFGGPYSQERGREIATLIRKFKERFEGLKEKYGLRGFYGDSPNTTLIDHFQRHFEDSFLANPPAFDRRFARTNYDYDIRSGRYPRKYANTPVTRIVFGYT